MRMKGIALQLPLHVSKYFPQREKLFPLIQYFYSLKCLYMTQINSLHINKCNETCQSIQKFAEFIDAVMGHFLD